MLSSDDQIELLEELIPSTLLPEEVNMLGFMPLKSYISSKKAYKAEKTPTDREDLVRAYNFVKALEELGCTIKNLQNTEKVAQ